MRARAIPVETRLAASPTNSKRVAAFRRALLRWYDHHRRDLPWRKTRDPYRIWLSEIMLQQTRVAAVLDHYRIFLERFPSVEALAAAAEDAVLAAWSGLGYYRRASARVLSRTGAACAPGGSSRVRSRRRGPHLQATWPTLLRWGRVREKFDSDRGRRPRAFAAA